VSPGEDRPAPLVVLADLFLHSPVACRHSPKSRGAGRALPLVFGL